MNNSTGDETRATDHDDLTEVSQDASDTQDATDHSSADTDYDHSQDGHESGYHEEEIHEERYPSLSARLLTWLVLLLAGAGLALWGAPKIAPNLPEWAAPAQKFLTPGATSAQQEVEALRADIDGRLNALPTGTDEDAVRALISTELDTLRAQTAEQTTALETRITDLQDTLAAIDGTDIEQRLGQVEGRLEGISAGLNSVTSTLENVVSEGGTISEEALTQITSRAAELEGVQAEVAQLASRVGAVSQRIDDVEAKADRRVAEAESAADAARMEAAARAADVAYQTALDALRETASAGDSYTAQLDAMAGLLDQPVAEPLLANAESGVPSIAQLREQFADVSHAAIRASITQDGGENGGVSRIGAFLKSQVATRSLEPVEGTSADAVLSRIGAALDKDALGTIATEADALSASARAPLEDWLGRVNLRKSVMDAIAALNTQPS